MTASMTTMAMMTIVKLSKVSSWCSREKPSSSTTPMSIIYDLTLLQAMCLWRGDRWGNLKSFFSSFVRLLQGDSRTLLGCILQNAFSRCFFLSFRGFESSQTSQGQPWEHAQMQQRRELRAVQINIKHFISQNAFNFSVFLAISFSLNDILSIF